MAPAPAHGTVEAPVESIPSKKTADPFEVADLFRARAEDSLQRAKVEQQRGVVSLSQYPTGAYFIHRHLWLPAFGEASDVLSSPQVRRKARIKGFEPSLANSRPTVIQYDPKEGIDPQKVETKGDVVHIREREDAAFLGMATGVRCRPVPIQLLYDNEVEPRSELGWVLAYDRSQKVAQGGHVKAVGTGHASRRKPAGDAP